MADTPASSGLTPYVNIDGVRKAIEFYQRAFAAQLISIMPPEAEGGAVMHAHVQINDAPLFLSDFFPEYGFPPVPLQGFNLHLQVKDADFWWKRAIEAGCTITMPIEKQFWGDYYGQLKDPYGITWAIGETRAA